VAVGNDDATSGMILFSSDGGQTWDRGVNPLLGNLHGVATDGNGNWVAVGDGGIVLHTANTAAWAAGSNTSSDLYGVATDGNGQWVAAGSDGHVRYSVNNGQAWQPGVSGTTDSLQGLAVDGAGNWITVGDEGTNGIVLFSTDGRTWDGETDLSPYFLLDIACD
jgi:photosystem II stability/assembly factor-like uncharacterized protein